MTSQSRHASKGGAPAVQSTPPTKPQKTTGPTPVRVCLQPRVVAHVLPQSPPYKYNARSGSTPAAVRPRARARGAAATRRPRRSEGGVAFVHQDSRARALQHVEDVVGQPTARGRLRRAKHVQSKRGRVGTHVRACGDWIGRQCAARGRAVRRGAPGAAPRVSAVGSRWGRSTTPCLRSPCRQAKRSAVYLFASPAWRSGGTCPARHAAVPPPQRGPPWPASHRPRPARWPRIFGST
jgi:hypothetical protein